jgi:hypothetical protein
MTEANDAQTYEQRVQAIQLSNQPILDGFETWLRQSGLSEQTIRDHVDNIRFFSRYLLLYAYSLRRLDEATEGNVYDFLEDWFPRKALWASVSSMKVYLASFKKFFKWMGESASLLPKLLRMCSQRSKTTETSSSERWLRNSRNRGARRWPVEKLVPLQGEKCA